MQKLVSVEGHRWAIDDGFETAKNELGLDHNETRSWHGWHHQASLLMLAFAMMAVIRHRANAESALKKTRRRRRSAGRSRKSVASLSSSLNGASRSTVFSHGRSGGELTRPTLAALTSDEKCNCSAS